MQHVMPILAFTAKYRFPVRHPRETRIVHRAAGVIVAAVAAVGLPVPQQPFLHPRLFVLRAALWQSVNPVQAISAIGFERDVDTTAKAVIYAPTGTAIQVGQAPGTVVGTPGVRIDVAGTTLAYNPRIGGLTVADPASYAGQTCDPGPHAAVWLVHATPTKNYGPGPPPSLSLTLPIYVDAIAPSPATMFSSYELEMCFGSDGWPAGAVVRRLTLNLSPGVVAERPPSPGVYDWRGVFTTVGVAGSIESRAILALPVDLVLHGTYNRARKAIAVTGTLTQGGQPVAGDSVVIAYGTKLGAGWYGIVAPKRAVTHTTALGRIAVTVPATRTTYVRASLSTVSMAYVDATGCAPPSLATDGCLTATEAGFTVRNSLVKVAVP